MNSRAMIRLALASTLLALSVTDSAQADEPWCSTNCAPCDPCNSGCVHELTGQWTTCGAYGMTCNSGQWVDNGEWWIGERKDLYRNSDGECFVREFYCHEWQNTCGGYQRTCNSTTWSEGPVTLDQCNAHTYGTDCSGCPAS